MSLIEYLGKISLQLYDLKLELAEIKNKIDPAPPKGLPTLDISKLKKMAVEEALRTTGSVSKAAKLTGISERTIARIMSGEE